MTISTKKTVHYFKQSFQEWKEYDAFGKSAALAYYSVFSLPGLLIIIITVAGLVWTTDEVQGELVGQVTEMAGESAAEQIRTMISNAQQQTNSTWALIIGVATLIFGATGLFFQLQKSLNAAWQVERKPGQGIKGMLSSRLTALLLVLAIGILLMASMLATTAVSAMSDWIQQNIINLPAFVFMLVQEILSFGAFTLLFALIFKVLPDAEVEWRSVWVGAMITALLFSLGKFLLGFYFGHTTPSSTFGSAGSIILLLLWAYYSSLIFLFGAKFTQVYARSKGHKIVPSSYAQHSASYRQKEKDQ